MRHGIEGPLKSADNRMIRREERSDTDSETLISAYADAALELVNDPKTVAALNGEEYFHFIKDQTNPDKQMKIAKKILNDTPFIKKRLPSHIEEENHQAALIVAIAITLGSSTEKMN